MCEGEATEVVNGVLRDLKSGAYLDRVSDPVKYEVAFLGGCQKDFQDEPDLPRSRLRVFASIRKKPHEVVRLVSRLLRLQGTFGGTMTTDPWVK